MSRRSKRRDVEVAGLSFLDAICCGFGAIILLLVLTKFAEPVIIEQTTEQLDAIIRSLEEELVQIRGETKIANAALVSKKEQLSEDERRLARLQGDLSRLQGEFAASDSNAAVSSTIAGQLAEARQRLTLEMQRLQSAQQKASLGSSLVGGIPVDSEYIIFIIDTSGSMQNFSWRTLLRKINEVLDAIRVLAQKGHTMIIVSHEMSFVREVSTKVAFMDAGRILEVGEPEKIMSNPETKRAKEFMAKILRQ